MKSIIKKAEILIEALPYILKFRGEIIVVKFGGSALDDLNNAKSIIEDISFMECVGMKPVVVHGGGKAISRGMKEHGISAEFVNGFRVTRAKTIKVVERIFNDEVNPAIVQMMKDIGAKASSLHGEDIFHVHKKKGVCNKTGKGLDWGFVGVPADVDTKPIRSRLRRGAIPVITPLGMGPNNKIHNINADLAAAAVARALKARKIAFISDVPGLLRNPKDPSSVMATLHVEEVEELIEQGVIAGGMLPKVESGVEALRAGVKKVHMIDGHMPHSLLLEIFTDKGVGTEIVK
jgi:acetylglutamate kinase